MDKSYRQKFGDKSTFVLPLGRGTQAIVDKHILNDQNVYVAVKNFNPADDGNISGSALKELNCLKKLTNCTNIIQLLDVYIDILPSRIIMLRIMMPYYKEDLESFIINTPFPKRLENLPSIIEQLLNALYNLHYRGIIHCDIKPANILIDDFLNVYLADFGLAVQTPCQISYRNIYKDIVGTPLYKSSELLTGHHTYDEKVDIWSLGLVILEYLISSVITYPSEDYAGDDDTNITYEILLNSVNSGNDVQNNYKLVESSPMRINDHINVAKILKKYLPNNYTLISNDITNLLISMLQINPLDRANITSLQKGAVCPVIYEILQKGEFNSNTNITLDEYYNIIHKINISDSLGFRTSTCYYAIDLLERYVSNKTTNHKKLKIMSAACLILVGKFYETKNIDYDDIINYYDNTFTLDNLKYAEISLLKDMNYLLTSCDNDDIIHVLDQITINKYKNMKFARQIDFYGYEDKISIIEQKDIYPLLLRTYKLIKNDNLFSNNMFPFEIVEYIEKNNI